MTDATEHDAQGQGSWPLRCSADPRRSAIAFCATCVQPFSREHLGVRPDGRAICRTCAREEGVEDVSTVAAGAGVDPVLERGWFAALGDLLLRPRIAMARPFDGSAGPAVLFGFVTTLFGFVATTGWNLALDAEGLTRFVAESVPAAAEMTPTQIRQMLWLATPVVSTLRFCGGALLLHLGIRALAGPAAGDLRSSARVFGLASGTLVLCAVPVVGPFLAVVTWISVCMAHVQAQLGMPMLRGMMAVLPSLLLISRLGPLPFTAG